MKLTIDSMLRLQDVPADILRQIKAELTIQNPDYIKKKAMGLNRWAWGPEYIKLWSEKTVDGWVGAAPKEYIIPRGYYARLWQLISNLPVDRTDNRLLLPPVYHPGIPRLRDYQEPALDQARIWQQGVTIMPCGSGKTRTALAYIAELEQPTLWITHTMELLKQSMDAAVECLGVTGSQIGVIQGKNMSIGSHMTFATVQTLSKRDLSEIKNKFGCIVVDETHLVFKDADKSRMFESVISQFPAYYRFGMTASEFRSDGLIDTMFAVIGPKFYEVEQTDPRLKVVKPTAEFIETDFNYDQGTDEDGEKEMLNVQQMYRAMREDHVRNSIIENIFAFKFQEGDCFICLGDSLDHLREGKFIAQTYNHTAAFICGETPKQEREKIMADMRAGKYQFLFATYSLAKLGLDIQRLNKLVLMTPHRDKTSIQQAVGRIMREFEGKPQPVVYDIWDSKVPQLVHWARDRVRVYRSLGCQVTGGPKVRKW